MRIGIVIITDIIEECVFSNGLSIVLNFFQALIIVGLWRRQAGAIIVDDAVDRWTPATLQVEHKIIKINFLWLLNVLLIICMLCCCFYVGDVFVVLMLQGAIGDEVVGGATVVAGFAIRGAAAPTIL